MIKRFFCLLPLLASLATFAATAPPPCVTVRPNGKVDLPSGSVSTAASTTSGIQEALSAAATNGGGVWLAPGRYTITSKIIIPTNCWLSSMPGSSTIINNIPTATSACAIVFRDNSMAVGLTVTNALMDSISQNCYGVMNTGGDVCATNWSIIDCVGYGDDDDIHLVHTQALKGVKIQGGQFFSKFDCVAIGGVGNPAHTVTIRNARIYAIGPSVHTPNAGANAINITGTSSTTLDVYDSFVYTTNKVGSTAYAVSTTGAAVTLYATTCWYNGGAAGSSTVTPFHVSGGTLTNNGGLFDPQGYMGDLIVGPTFTVYPLCQVLTNIFTPYDPAFTTPSPFSVIVNDADVTHTNTFDGLGGLTIDGLASVNGVITLRSNKVVAAVAAITVGASEFSFTNTFGVDIIVYISGQTTGSLKLNTVTIASPMVTSPLSVHLQPGEWLAFTYTGSPVMKWKPF